jgi:hypothetical protein
MFILLRLVIDVMLSCSSESVYKSKAKGKSKRVPAKVLIEFLITKWSGNIKSEGDAASV